MSYYTIKNNTLVLSGWSEVLEKEVLEKESVHFFDVFEVFELMDKFNDVVIFDSKKVIKKSGVLIIDKFLFQTEWSLFNEKIFAIDTEDLDIYEPFYIFTALDKNQYAFSDIQDVCDLEYLNVLGLSVKEFYWIYRHAAQDTNFDCCISNYIQKQTIENKYTISDLLPSDCELIDHTELLESIECERTTDFFESELGINIFEEIIDADFEDIDLIEKIRKS
ncbi:hypothetical protein E2R68_00685 [Psychromonas sp. RZ22]|uniref:hypothetical protein n=1 Tax=Psychromonas algarum TaxID=2555643 RepID=UPI001068A017|nr:hypothetical protein [Psychromonas sp. RZ22]TEW56585.1 hypothetical protein E2R68_00685 [Psychromonas sp. RZ22]